MKWLVTLFLLSGCGTVIGPGIRIVDTQAAALYCGGAPACAYYNQQGCTVYVSRAPGLGDLYLRLTAWTTPEVALNHEICHCFEGDFHHPLFWFLGKGRNCG